LETVAKEKKWMGTYMIVGLRRVDLLAMLKRPTCFSGQREKRREDHVVLIADSLHFWH
jgi:hypothetical protein